jgi:hypothetical protein
VVHERVDQDECREHAPDDQPRLGQIEVAGDRGDEPEHDAEREDPPADRREPVLGCQDAAKRADVARRATAPDNIPWPTKIDTAAIIEATCRNVQKVATPPLPARHHLPLPQPDHAG